MELKPIGINSFEPKTPERDAKIEKPQSPARESQDSVEIGKSSHSLGTLRSKMESIVKTPVTAATDNFSLIGVNA